MSYLRKVIATAAVAASVAGIGTVSASADSVTVKSGDTLSAIAEANNTDADKLASVNHISNKNLIFVGDVIELGSVKAVTPKADTTVAQTTPAATATASATAVQPAKATASVATSDALNTLIQRESGGNTNATNGQYYGLGQLSPQARAVYGGNSSDYNDQLNAMKAYITDRYGTAENALAHSNATGWY